MGVATDDRLAVRPRLLVLASTYPRWPSDHEPGFVHELCRRLAARFDVVVLTSRSPGAAARESMDGVQVVRYAYAPKAIETLVYGGGIATHLKRSPWKLLLVPGFMMCQYLAANRLMKSHRFDLVHAHWLIPQGRIALALKRKWRVPFLVTSHGGDLFGLRGALLTSVKRHVAAASAAMTVVSSAMKDESARLGLEPPHLSIIPMGADMQTRFVPSVDVVRSSDELLFVGRLVAKKGLTHLLDAMPALLRRCPTAHLSIAGFGPESDALERQAARLGIGARVTFLGAFVQDQLPALYQRAAVLVAPFIRDSTGNQEGLPVVLMEAIGCGCPVVAGRVAGVHDLFGDDADAVCVDPLDPSALATAIAQVIEKPEDARARAQELRERMAARFDWSTIADRYAHELAACLERSAGD